jgi:hypothetical protein
MRSRFVNICFAYLISKHLIHAFTVHDISTLWTPHRCKCWINLLHTASAYTSSIIINFVLLYFHIGTGKTVGILTRLRVRKYEVWIPEEAGIFSPLPNRPTRRWGPPKLLFNVECGSFTRVKWRLQNSRTIPPVPLYGFTAKTEKK